jgi:AhpD family alkylhydroperoxidase
VDQPFRTVIRMTTTTTDETTPLPRVDLMGPWPEGYRALLALDAAVGGAVLDTSLLNLVKQRASQVNGCPYCLDMHAKEARKAGESQQRLDVLQAWREAPLFSEQEQAALALTEAITLVADGHVPDAVVDEARRHFSPEQFAQLVFAIVSINAWNRVAITSRAPLPPPADG